MVRIGLLAGFWWLGGLGAAGAQTCRPQLMGRQMAQLGTTGAGQTQAIATLTQCGDAAVPILLDDLNQTQSIPAQLAIVDTLVAIGPEAAPDLTQRISDATIAPEIRGLMVEALGAIAQTHDSTTLVIVQRLTERQVDPKEEPLVQRQAALALRELDQAPTVSFLERLYTALQANPEWVAALGTFLALGLTYLGCYG